MTTTHTRRHAGGLLLGLTGLLGAALTAPAAAQPALGPADADSATVAAGAAEIAGAERAARKPKRTLRVRVKRPAQARKLVKVTVRGPKQRPRSKKFKKTFAKTRTFKRLKPGVYRIKARTISMFDQRIKPRVVKKKVRITKRTKRKTSRVTYAAPVFCATSGTVAYGWGEGDHGRLGTSDATDRLAPVVIPRIRGLKEITGGARSTYGLCADGTVWSWGYNANGELGIGRSGHRSWPVRVPGLSGVTAIAANRESAYALRSDGTVWAWGNGRYGQLGNGRAGFGYRSSTPVKVSLPAPARAIAAGGYNAYAILNDGRVASWGAGGVGQLGNGTAGTDAATPVEVDFINDATAIEAGHATAYVLRASGEVWAWGYGNQGEVGHGLTAHRTQPINLPSIAGAVGIGANGAAGFRIGAGGTVHSWGSGRHGDVAFDNAGNPQASPISNVTLTQVRRIVGRGHTGYALTTTGRVWAWGDHQVGQVGHGAPKTGPAATDGVPTPVELPLGGIKAIGAGTANGYALR